MFTVKMTKYLVVFLILPLGIFIMQGCNDHEHPAEHPSGSEVTVTKDQLADAIEIYIADQSSATGGKFVVLDDKTGETLRLSLDRVHRERLSTVGENTYFACADFVTDEGKVYDLDVFMTGPDKDNLAFSEFSLHKEAGKERYTWYQEDGVWKRKIPDEEGAEHPNKEHPDKEHPTKEHP